MNAPVDAPTRAERFHFIDVGRALLMLLGIPFHAALAFTEHHWVVRAPQSSAWLEHVPHMLSAFRMAGFFLIAGFFAALLLERRPAGAWLKGRVVRLGVPLVAGVLVIVPLQNLVLFLGPPGVTHVPHDLGGAVLSHLWFLPALLMLCAVLAVAWRGVRLVTWPDLPIWLIGLLCAAWSFGLYFVTVHLEVRLRPLDGLLGIEAVLKYAPYFMLGVVTRRNCALFERIKRWNWFTALLGAAALVCYAATYEEATTLQLVLALLSGAMAAVCVSQSLLAALAQLADRQFPLVDRFVNASLSIYLFHHPVIIVLILASLPLNLPAGFAWLAICAATLAITYLLHRAIARSSVLLFLFNGRVAKQERGLLTGDTRP